MSDFRMSDFRMSDCRMSGVELLWKWVSAASGEVLDQAGHKSPTEAPQLAIRTWAIQDGDRERKRGFGED